MDDDMADEETRLNAETTATNDDTVEADEGTIATRILRRRRAPAAVVAQDLLADPVVPFVLYLCSGSQRDNDLAAHLHDNNLSAIQIDYCECGGIGHDLAREDVAERAIEL
eukprot:4044278-Pleurochrysis_carterae.AAC.1